MKKKAKKIVKKAAKKVAKAVGKKAVQVKADNKLVPFSKKK